MTLRPLDDVPRSVLAGIRLLATDIDETMTTGGKLQPEVLAAMLRLSHAGIAIVPVTGRPAGEALGLARYLPTVRMAIAENGGALVTPDAEIECLAQAPDRPRLYEAAVHLGRGGKPWVLAPDSFCRVTDVAWLREDREATQLAEARIEAAALGLFLIWSSVHIHLSMHPPDKGLGVLHLCQRLGVPPAEVGTIGDSPNDAGLWVAGRFGLTVGTAAVPAQAKSLDHLPDYVTQGDAGTGWLQLAQRLLDARA